MKTERGIFNRLISWVEREYIQVTFDFSFDGRKLVYGNIGFLGFCDWFLGLDLFGIIGVVSLQFHLIPFPLEM